MESRIINSVRVPAACDCQNFDLLLYQLAPENRDDVERLDELMRGPGIYFK